LIKKLQKIKGNPKIIVSADSEGNSFTELDSISSNLFWHKENRELFDIEEIQEYDMNPLPECVVLWPR
ncbi:MAG: hypothetical protein Q7R95_07295, partial [bacterium]|nr:hypothetical protein [bacterium]